MYSNYSTKLKLVIIALTLISSAFVISQGAHRITRSRDEVIIGRSFHLDMIPQ